MSATRAPKAARGRSGGAPAPDPATVLLAEWRDFVGGWLRHVGCGVSDSARGDWEVALSPALAARWRRRRVRLVFDPRRPSLPRGSWFCAPGSLAGQRILESARERPAMLRRTALPQVPGAPAEGFAAVCKVRGLAWAAARLGPVEYRPRVAFHVAVTLWGGLPRHESWTLLVDGEGRRVEAGGGLEVSDLRSRAGVPSGFALLRGEGRSAIWPRAREHLDRLLEAREAEWDHAVSGPRDAELQRLGSFFGARLAEEEERARRRQPTAEDGSLNGGDTRSLKVEWERRAEEVRARWAVRAEGRLWGITDWAWPVAVLEQELRAGAVRVRIRGEVDVARGRPELPACPACGSAADYLFRRHSAVACARCPDLPA